MALGDVLFLCAVILDGPKNAANLGSISLRTTVFEPLALAILAWLLPGWEATLSLLARGSCYLLALSLIVFWSGPFPRARVPRDAVAELDSVARVLGGVLAVAFIAGGLSIGLNFLQRWGAVGIGLMFGIWVVTLHLPRVLGLAITGAPHDPNEWSSLLIAIALWGGSWALARAHGPSCAATSS